MINPTGKVYLIGAGLGEIAYLTLQAQQLLSQAEVIIYLIQQLLIIMQVF